MSYDTYKVELAKMLVEKKNGTAIIGVNAKNVHDTVAELRRVGKKILNGSSVASYITQSIEDHKVKYPNKHSGTDEHKAKYPALYTEE